MPIAYFASRISDHLGHTPEGFLVAPDVVVGRTGWQVYKAGELPREAAQDLGIDLSNPEASVNVYRPPEEVFAASAIAALEGKPICDQHPPDEQFVTPENIGELQMGHVQNVRKGDKPLDSGDWPLLGDLMITREPLLSKVESGDQREVSLGYSYTLAKDGGKLLQTKIVPNHCAIVKKARAGPEARIADAAPTDSEPTPPAEAPAAEVPKGEATLPAVQDGRAGAAALTNDAKPEQAVKPIQQRNLAGSSSTGNTKGRPNMLKRIFGLGLKALATDEKTTPEELAEAAEAMKPDKEEKPPKPAEDRRPADDRRADDRRADDRRADDRRADDSHRADDRRVRMHAALDKMLAGEPSGLSRREPEPEPVAAEDVDLEELRDLLSEFFEEEEAEPQHQEGAEGEGGPEPVSEPEPEPVAADCGMPRKARVGDQFIEPIDGPGSESAGDALDVLNTLRPFVARSRDTAVIRAFNGQLARFSRSAAPTNGGYSAFAEASRHRAADVAAEPGQRESERNKRLQEAYDKAHTGVK